MNISGKVKSLHLSPTHNLIKNTIEKFTLVEGMGVMGDAHFGEFVQHVSRQSKDPNQPNLRQVHLIHSELLDELEANNFNIEPGQMGENITTQGVDLLNLPKGTILKIREVRIEVTGLRSPCAQLNRLQDGLMNELIFNDKEGNIVRKAGIMGIVLKGGEIKRDDNIEVIPPQGQFIRLVPV